MTSRDADLPLTIRPIRANRIGYAMVAIVVLGAGAVSVWGGFAVGFTAHTGWLLVLLGVPAVAYGGTLLIRAPRIGVVLDADHATVHGLLKTTRIPRRRIREVTDFPSILWVDEDGGQRGTPVYALNINDNGRPDRQFVAENEAKIADIRNWAADADPGLANDPLPEGQLLSGLTAHAWLQLTFALLGAFLSTLIALLFTAPAFHPEESAAVAAASGTWFIATFFPVLVLFFASVVATGIKGRKEQERGYTTIRWADPAEIQVRDSRGRIIPAGDKRLARSARLIGVFWVVAAICAPLSVIFFLLRVVFVH